MKKRIKDLTKEEMENQGFMLMLHQMGEGDENGISPCKVIHFDKSVNDFLNTEVDIPQPHILDKQEHDYLRAVIKPYIKDIKKLIKRDYGNYVAYIELTKFTTLTYTNENLFKLPLFDSSLMYKGMEVDKKYTIEELELDKEWNND